jgi:GNAT superfamily N-acetyltransferase
VIRSLEISELGSLIDLALEFYASSKFLEHFDIERFRDSWTQLLQSGLGVILIYEVNGKPIGAIGGFFHQDIYGDLKIVEEMFWFTSTQHRGVGIRLYRAFEQWAKSKNADRLQMVHLVDSMPEKLEAFYLREGFEPIEMRYGKKLAA